MYPGMTVYENLAFPLEARKMPRDEIRIRVKEAASLLRIEHLLDKIATKLTAGEKQRVALGRAIVRRPQVYLLDEPLTNLDARLRAEMRVELKALQRKLKQTTIYVTHDQLEGMTMADRIAVMSQGEIQQYDTPDNIYRYPRNLFVAGFVGSPTMNFLDCTFKEHGKGYIFDFGSFTLDASRYSDIIEKYSTSPELILGVRPEHVSVHSESITDGIKGRLEVFEPLGDSFIYDVSVNGSILRVLMLQRLDLRPGEDVWLKFDPERVYIFDKKTSKALI
jgi:ABC-type sugar transport system ATPase subunit